MMQMRSLFAMRVSMQDNYLVYGILDVLRQFGVKTSYVLFGSMLIGTLVCAITSFFISRSQIFQNNLFLSYLTPAVVSVFWSYKSQCDYNILIIAAVGLVEYWCSGHQSWRKLFLIAWMEILLLMKPFSLLSALSSVLLGTNRLGNVYLINRVDLYAKVVIYIIFVIVVLRQRRIATV